MSKTGNSCWIGFDLGGTKMMAVVYDAAFRARASTRVKTKASEGPNMVLDRMLKTMHAALDEAGVGAGQLAGIGVGCPGPLDLDRGVVLSAPNLGWENMALKKTLEKEFGCPAVLANDVDAGVYAEYRFGAARGARCVVGVFPGTGVGGGCVYEGKLLRGRIGSCMEIGHIMVEPDGRLCGCGRRGCLETVASRLAIAAEAAMAACRGEAPHLMKEAGADVSAIRSGALARAIKAGDRVVEDIVRRAARKLGLALAGVVNLLAPDVVVLGGGLVEAMPQLFLKEVGSAMKAQAMPAFAAQTRLVAAQLGDDATALGSAALASQWVETRFHQKPKPGKE
jgi:glucokinase